MERRYIIKFEDLNAEQMEILAESLLLLFEPISKLWYIINKEIYGVFDTVAEEIGFEIFKKLVENVKNG